MSAYAAARAPAAAAAPPEAPDHEVTGVPDDCISSLAWSPANSQLKLLAATSWDRSVRLWEVAATAAAGGLVTAPQSRPVAAQQAHSAPLLSCAVARDGRVFYGGCCKTAVMWAPQTNQTQQVAAHDLPISCVRYVEDGVAAPMLITAGWDGKVRFWDTRQAAPVREEAYGFPITHMDTSTAPFATFLSGRGVHVYDLNSMQRFKDLAPAEPCRFQLRQVSNFASKQQVAASTIDGRLTFMGLNNQPATQFKGHGGEVSRAVYEAYPINFIAVHPTGNTAITAGSDGIIRSFNLTTKTRFYESTAKMVPGTTTPVPVSCGAMNAEGNLLATAYSYDWTLGKGSYAPTAPRAICIKALSSSHVR